MINITNKLIILILIILASIQISSASTLVDQPYTTFGNSPIYISQCRTTGSFWLCVTSHATDDLNPNIANLQSVTVLDSWGTISRLKFFMKRESTCLSTCNNDPILKVEVYRSSTTSFSDAVLWDTATYNPSNTNVWNEYSFTFDADIPIYNIFDQKIVETFWIKYYEQGTTLATIDSSRFINVVFADTLDDKYTGGSLLQTNDGTTYTDFNYPYNIAYAFDYYKTDLAFKLFGTFHIPQTPVPPPIILDPNSTDTTILPDGCSMEDFYSGLCSNIPDIFWQDTTQYVPDFNTTYINHPEYLNNTSIGIPSNKITNEALPVNILQLFGYCDSSGCTTEDVFNLLYDVANWLMILSFLYLFYVIYGLFKNRNNLR